MTRRRLIDDHSLARLPEHAAASECAMGSTLSPAHPQPEQIFPGHKHRAGLLCATDEWKEGERVQGSTHSDRQKNCHEIIASVDVSEAVDF